MGTSNVNGTLYVVGLQSFFLDISKLVEAVMFCVFCCGRNQALSRVLWIGSCHPKISYTGRRVLFGSKKVLERDQVYEALECRQRTCMLLVCTVGVLMK